MQFAIAAQQNFSAPQNRVKKISGYKKSFLRHFYATADFISQLQEEKWPVFTSGWGDHFNVQEAIACPIDVQDKCDLLVASRPATPGHWQTPGGTGCVPFDR